MTRLNSKLILILEMWSYRLRARLTVSNKLLDWTHKAQKKTMESLEFFILKEMHTRIWVRNPEVIVETAFSKTQEAIILL